MKNIFLQIIATSCAIAAISGVKVMDLPALPTILLVIIVVLGYLFVLAGGIFKLFLLNHHKRIKNEPGISYRK